jgi:hypothetical protein
MLQCRRCAPADRHMHAGVCKRRRDPAANTATCGCYEDSLAFVAKFHWINSVRG